MKHMRIIFGFVPWFTFYSINNNSPRSIYIAGIIAIALVIALDKKELRNKFILPWGTIIFFVLLSAIAKFDMFAPIMKHSLILANIGLPLIMWVSILVDRPFTLQYAKLEVDKVYWKSPLFLKTNRTISLAWAVLMTISAIPFIILPETVINNSLLWNYGFSILCVIIAVTLTQKLPNIIIGRNFWNTVKNLPAVDSPFLKGGYAPVKEELDLNNLTIHGHIPKDLHGRYLRNGPNQYFTPYSHTYPIDGDGMIHQIILDNDTAHYKNRFVKTKGLLSEIIAGKALYAGIKFPIPPDPRLAATDEITKNPASINIIPWGDELLALYETSTAYKMDYELNTLGEWAPVSGEKFRVNAHYRIDPQTGHTFMFTYRFDDSMAFLEIYEFDKEQNLINRTPVNKPRPTMIHDFVITENYIVIFDCPAFFNPFDDEKDFLSFESDVSVKIILINRFTHEIKFLDGIPYFWVYHFVNGYEEDGKIIVDFVHYGALQLNSESKTKYPARLYRGEIDLKYGSYSHYELSEQTVEFPSYNTLYTGRKYRYAYMATKSSSDTTNFNALLKYDFATKTHKIIEFGTNIEVDEATFVAKKNALDEDAGYLMLFIYNTITDKSDFVILEAFGNNDIITRIELPVRVPHGLHGSWINQK